MSSRFQTQINNDRNIGDYIPMSNHVTDDTIITREGDLMRTWKIDGISFESADLDELVIRKEQLNTLLRSIANDQVAIWTHIVRRRTSDRLDANFQNEFCQEYNQKYFDSFDNYRMMANELYVTLIYRPIHGALNRRMARRLKRTEAQIRQDISSALIAFKDQVLPFEKGLSRYVPTPLAVTHKDGVAYSDALSFYNFLITGVWQPVRLPTAPINDYIGNAWIFTGADTIEIRHPTGTRFAQGIDFKDYAPYTEPGILNALFYLPFEFVATQSFSFFSKPSALKYLDRQQKQLTNAQDVSPTQIDEMSVAMDRLTNGDFALGEYHFSLLVFADSVEQVAKNRAMAIATIQDLGFIAAQIILALDAAFYAQLPANWEYRPRIANLTTRNFSGLSSLHNFLAGKRDHNPWGQAITILKSPSGQPFYLNYHYSRRDEDDTDKKLLGNTRIIGQSGSGKTVLMGHLYCQSQKYRNYPKGFTDIFFDKDHGAEIMIRRMGGKYLAIKNGQPTGFNPFQLDPTEDNITFLNQLVRHLSGQLTAQDDIRLTQAIQAVMKMPRNIRRLSVLLQNLTEGVTREQKENSLAKKLSAWCYDDGSGRRGQFAWVLDCPHDKIDFETHKNYGFDGTDFLDNPAVRTPISMYLLHRMESIIDGRRIIYYMDEAWKWVDDEAFGEFVGNKQLTIRKQNGLGVFATQMPSSFLESKYAAQLTQQVATQIYLPNPAADRDEYVDGFKVTEAEYDLIRQLAEDSRTMLVKQGGQSAITTLDLKGFERELAIMSGSTDATELLHEIMAEVGEDPNVWEPIFHERRRKLSIRTKP